ncbi:MAG: biotin--[acetyl-CoA-carboxylase] ligase [Bacteroidota bacterium]|nr:biotin--[acetyl-CoA-carboxylase] ligase [Bacteroidota bacterium]
MKTLFIGQNSIHLGTVDSTNSYASEMLRQKSVLDGTLIVSYGQEKGKGQRGNQWLSEPDKNVAASIILYPGFLSPDQQFMLNKIISLAVADLMTECLANTEIHIKWPNDIYAGKKKIAGILIENTLRDGKIQHSIIGIGVNINQMNFEPGLNATSMALESKIDFNLTVIVERLCSFVEARYLQLKGKKIEKTDEEYESLLYRRNAWHCYSASNEKFEGKIKGVAGSGKVIMELRNGESKEFDLKEIEFIP